VADVARPEGRVVKVGVVLPQIKAEWQDVAGAARRAEELGADSVWVVDHLMWMPPQLGTLESWTLLSALAASTESVELGAQVLCQSFRNPALLAKMAATLDRVSNGRFRLLIGAGWFEDEYRAFGFEFPSAGVRVTQLRESVRILKGMLGGSGEPFSFDGEHYRVHEVVNAPPPVRAPLGWRLVGPATACCGSSRGTPTAGTVRRTRSATSTTDSRFSARSAMEPDAPLTSSR
jgi:alkanesulfonate monooxygenase SsuD/methylene tetrahydromethanopterin reductase-like flavin-dependent oxidoreductase (luciferase family)